MALLYFNSQNETNSSFQTVNHNTSLQWCMLTCSVFTLIGILTNFYSKFLHRLSLILSKNKWEKFYLEFFVKLTVLKQSHLLPILVNRYGQKRASNFFLNKDFSRNKHNSLKKILFPQIHKCSSHTICTFSFSLLKRLDTTSVLTLAHQSMPGGSGTTFN